MAVLVVAAAATAWSAVAVERHLAALRAEVAATATLGTAHRVLRREIDDARRRRADLDADRDRAAESWGPGGPR
jgi:hypothetical protein